MVSRFHAMIGALSLHVPVGVVGWGYNYRKVMAEFSQEHFVLDNREVQSEENWSIHDELLQNLEEARAKIPVALPTVLERAARPMDSLKPLREVCGA
jgi:polysaccharide pyruvyl transferase WcaK-like protein